MVSIEGGGRVLGCLQVTSEVLLAAGRRDVGGRV